MKRVLKMTRKILLSNETKLFKEKLHNYPNIYKIVNKLMSDT